MTQSYPFPAELLPAVKRLWPRIDKVVTKRLHAMNELEPGESALEGVDPVPPRGMTGSFGAVYYTRARGWVVKVTCDPTEGPAAQAIMDSDILADHRGVVEIAGVWVSPETTIHRDSVELPFFVILREAVEPLDVSIELADVLDLGEGPAPLQALWDVRITATWFNAAYSDFDQLYRKDQLNEELEKLEAFDEARHVADFMGLFLEVYGAAIADAHPGNIGVRPGSEDWVLFDVGHSGYTEGSPVPLLPNPLVISVM